MDSRLAIYPTARKVEELLKSLSRKGCCFGHRVVTFPQLIDDLWNSLGDSRTLLSTCGEQVAVQEAIRRAASNGPFELDMRSGAPMAGVIRQFKSASVEPPDLLQASHLLHDCGTLEHDAALRRLTSIHAVFAEYESILREARLADRRDRDRAVLLALHRAESAGRRPPALAGIGQLLVAEIYDFSLLQFMIVTALIRVIGDAELTIQAAPHRVDASSFADLTWNRFVAEESIADKVLPDFVRRGGRKGRLGFALEHLFVADSPTPPPPDSTLAIVEAPTRRGEIEETARRIRRELEAGAAPERIAVVARGLEPYADYLDAVFRRYRIPLALDNPRPLAATAAARFALDLCAAPLRALSRAAIRRILESPILPHLKPRIRTLERAGYLDRAARPFSQCAAAVRAEMESELAAASDDERRERLARLDGFKSACGFLQRLLEDLESFESPVAVADHIERLCALMKSLGFDPVRMDYPAARAAGALMAALSDLARESALTARGRAVSLEEFVELMRIALGDTGLDAESREPGRAVRALAVIDARGLDFDQVFILGLNDGAFPLYHPDDPLLPDDLKLALNRPLAAAVRARFGAKAPAALGRLLRTRFDRNSEDWLLFFLALSMASRRAVLSFAAADEAGRPLPRSPFVRELVRLLGPAKGAPLVERISPDFVPAAAADCFTRQDFLNLAAADSRLDPAVDAALGPQGLDSIRRRIAIDSAREDYFALPAREETDDHRALKEKIRIAAAAPYHGRVSAGTELRAMLLGEISAPLKWSAGRLTDMAQCGFKFFAGRLLRLRTEEELDREPSDLEFGELAHDLMRQLLDSEPHQESLAAALERAHRLLEDRHPIERARARDPAFFELSWSSLEALIEEELRWDFDDRRRCGGREFGHRLEREFEFVLDRPHPAADAKPGKVAVRGRIDRIDFTRGAGGKIDWLRVLDYKTSRSAERYHKLIKADDGEFLTEMQLPVYAIAATRLEEIAASLSPDAALEAGYLILRSRDKLQLRQIARASIEDRFVPQVAALAAAAAAGEFDVDPRVCSLYCPFREVCRYRQPGQTEP